MSAVNRATRTGRARGGFAVGFVVGLLAGLVIALGVALYVSKVPIPFVNKVPQRTAEQDAAEAERNKGWDPNAGLTGRPAVRPPAPAASAVTPPAATAAPAPAARAASAAPGATAARPAASAAAPGSTDPMVYYAQAGAFARGDDADAQRAKLALQGFEAQITEREQSGRTVYRVRVGPFNARADAERAIEQLKAAGVEAALVRVQKP
jgi:cell division protein FtsN